MAVETITTTCTIAGGGPAGMMLGFLLARAGVDVVVLEKHADFFRDFRGDTIHPSTLEVMYELGILDDFLKRPHQDVAELAGLIGEGTASFVTAARAHVGHEPISLPRATVSTIVGLLALDHHLHGGQFSETSGSVWGGRVADIHSPLRAVVPYAFDPMAARDFHGSFRLRLRGVEPLTYTVDNGRLELDSDGRVDCTMTADPQTFLLVGIGVVSQLRAALTGKLRAGGRKPWLASAFPRLFPPVPHGGVAR